jgi:NADH-quinone oxidoreductase subunit F
MLGPQILLDGIDHPESVSLKWYRSVSGYQAAERVLKTLKPDQIIEEVKASGLRGRGGAGFPAGVKWSFVPKGDMPKFLLCNADEGEPGTFKDRVLLSRMPHRLFEGMIIAAYAINARKGYIYIRGEFAREARILEKALAEAYGEHLLGKNLFGTGFDFDLAVYRGAGAYVCGEETALIESIEGKRGSPRLKPPFPASRGACNQPTVVNNVETLASVPWIMTHGGKEYAGLGTGKSTGTKLFSISGHVNRPGVYEVALGMPLMKFVEEFAGGIKSGMKLKAIIPGGSSTPILTAQESAEVNLDYESMAAKGTMLGSGAIVVMAEGTCLVRTLMVLSRFYAHESCGQCTPCRDGTPWIAKIVKSVEDGKGAESDLDLLLDICKSMSGNTICPLADAAVMPVQSYVTKFRNEFVDHVRQGRCPYPAWPL